MSGTKYQQVRVHGEGWKGRCAIKRVSRSPELCPALYLPPGYRLNWVLGPLEFAWTSIHPFNCQAITWLWEAIRLSFVCSSAILGGFSGGCPSNRTIFPRLRLGIKINPQGPLVKFQHAIPCTCTKSFSCIQSLKLHFQIHTAFESPSNITSMR